MRTSRPTIVPSIASGAFDAHASAPQLAQQIGQRGFVRQVHGESPQRASQRVGRAIRDTRHNAAPQILHDQAFEQIVDFARVKHELHGCGVLDFSTAFEEPHAGREQHNTAQRQVCSLMQDVLAETKPRGPEQDDETQATEELSA